MFLFGRVGVAADGSPVSDELRHNKYDLPADRTLARTARDMGKLPVTGPDAPTAHVRLQAALDQLGRLADVVGRA